MFQVFKYALEHDYDYIFGMDAVFSYLPSYLKEFITKRENYDFVIGSRYIKGERSLAGIYFGIPLTLVVVF